jgi:hypothetical protein
VRRRAPAVQQTGRTQQERTRADGGDATAAQGARPDCAEHRLAAHGLGPVEGPGDDEGVDRLAEVVNPTVDADPHT